MADDRAFQGDAFQTNAFQGPDVVQANAIGSSEAFGVDGALRIVRATSASSAEAFGAHDAAVRIVRAAAVASGEVFGVSTTRLFARAATITTGETAGTPDAFRLSLAAGVQTGETIPVPVADRIVGEASIGSAESFGTPQALAPILITASAIESGEAWGTPTATGTPAVTPTTGGSGPFNYIVPQPGKAAEPEQPEAPALRVAAAFAIETGQAFGTPTAHIGQAPTPSEPPGPPAVTAEELLLVGAL